MSDAPFPWDPQPVSQTSIGPPRKSPSDEIYERFSFHPATDTTGPLHDEVRRAHRTLAIWLEETLPDSRERSLALTALQESMMWANAAVAYRLK